MGLWDQIEESLASIQRIEEMKVKDALFLDPFCAVKSEGNHNGRDDSVIRSILKTDRFKMRLPLSSHLPERFRDLEVIQRIFSDNYDNVYIEIVAVLADESMFTTHENIPLQKTTHGERARLGKYVNAENVCVRDSYISGFRLRASHMLTKAQTKCLTKAPPKVIKKDPECEDLPPLHATNLMDFK